MITHSLASHRYKIHKTVKYKSYRNHKECNDNVKYEMSVSESRDLDKIEGGLAKLRNEVAIRVYAPQNSTPHRIIILLWKAMESYNKQMITIHVTILVT